MREGEGREGKAGSTEEMQVRGKEHWERLGVRLGAKYTAVEGLLPRNSEEAPVAWAWKLRKQPQAWETPAAEEAKPQPGPRPGTSCRARLPSAQVLFFSSVLGIE